MQISEAVIIKTRILVVILQLLSFYCCDRFRVVRAGDKAPAVGSTAPDFTLKSQENKPVSLHDFKGKWVVLYFYPKDFTSGCTVEAHNFQRDQAQYEARKPRSSESACRTRIRIRSFALKKGSRFKLLADTDSQVSTAYDSVMNMGVTKLSARHTFLIDPNGVVQKVWLDVKPEKHSEEVLAALDDLQKNCTSR